jgi:hypothetical protein
MKKIIKYFLNVQSYMLDEIQSNYIFYIMFQNSMILSKIYLINDYFL